MSNSNYIRICHVFDDNGRLTGSLRALIYEEKDCRFVLDIMEAYDEYELASLIRYSNYYNTDAKMLDSKNNVIESDMLSLVELIDIAKQ